MYMQQSSIEQLYPYATANDCTLVHRKLHLSQLAKLIIAFNDTRCPTLPYFLILNTLGQMDF